MSDDFTVTSTPDGHHYIKTKACGIHPLDIISAKLPICEFADDPVEVYIDLDIVIEFHQRDYIFRGIEDTKILIDLLLGVKEKIKSGNYTLRKRRKRR